MIESPLIEEVVKEIVAERVRKFNQEAKQEAILDVLEARFGAVPQEIQPCLARAASTAIG